MPSDELLPCGLWPVSPENFHAHRSPPQRVRSAAFVVSSVMLHAVIIDDSESARRSLAEDILFCSGDLVLIGEASSVRNGVPLIERLHPDIVFLDIELEDGSGFDLLEQLACRDFRLIFTTASDAHGIRAIKFGALDYLLKPIDRDDLLAAVEKATARPLPRGEDEGIGVMLESLRGLQGRPRRIALNTIDRVHVVNVADIIRCESERNYTRFHLMGKRHILVTRTLKDFDEMLVESGFFRTHHSHLVNSDCIKEYVKADGGYIVMCDGSQVPVAVRKREALLKMLEDG